MKKLLTLLFGLLTISTTVFAYDCTDTITSDVPEDQCNALVRLYNELDGDNWIENVNRLVDETAITNRFRITVNNNQIIEIDLGSNGLSGIISSRNGLTNLINLDLTLNEITQIPDSWEGLNNLETLELGANPFTRLPGSWYGLSNISLIYLAYNDISQEFPSTNITDLGNPSIRINNGKIYGDIPNEFINFSTTPSVMQENYFNTNNVEEPLLSHLNNIFTDSRNGITRETQQKAMTMFSSTLGYFNTIKNIVDTFCKEKTTGTEKINLVKFK